jgi:protoporphyrinogen oxidase
MSNKTNLIIGAGPAGMAAAMELCKKDQPFVVIEKDDRVGGLSKTYKFQEGEEVFLSDNGPHRFFSKNKYLYDFVSDLLKEKWIQVPRQTRQFIEGKFYNYPVNPGQALRNLGFFRAVRMVFDYLVAQVQYRVLRRPMVSFEDYIVANFGRSLGEFNMLNYTEKIWGLPCSTLHPDWAAQRIKGLNLISTVWEAVSRTVLGKSKDSPKSLIDVFYYPDAGTGLIYETIKQRIEENGYKIFTKSFPVSIKHENKKITEVVVNQQGALISYDPNYLIESMPIIEFVKLLEPAPPEEVKDALSKLRYRSQVYIFVTINKPFITKDQWIYFPDKNVPFGRVSEMKNFSAKMSPPDKTSLFVEYFCFEGDDIWNMSQEQLLDLTVKHFEQLGFFTRADVISGHLIKQRNTYPIYDLEYQKYLGVVKAYLDQFENLLYIGRPGRFRYNNQDHSLEMGILAAQSVITGKKYQMDDIGLEKEYFEKGYVPNEKK